MKIDTYPKAFYHYSQTLDGGKKILKTLLFALKWNRLFFSNSKLDEFSKQLSIGYKFIYIPKLYSDSYAFYQSIYQKKFYQAIDQSGKIIKDGYSIYGLLDQCKVIKKASWTYIIGYGLLASKAIYSTFKLKNCINKINTITNENKVLINILKIIKSIGWIFTFVITTYCMVYGSSLPILLLSLSSICLVSSMMIDLIKTKENRLYNSNYVYN